MKILIVEDEDDLRNVLEKRLKKQFTVDACRDGEEALAYLDAYEYDVILLDIMLPKVDGLTVLRRMRSQKIETAVILLTAKSLISDRVAGLDAGADDYLVKPFAYEELLARIRVLMRRTAGSSAEVNELRVGDLSLNVKTNAVTRSGQRIPLSRKEFLLLEYMMRNPNVVLTRRQLEQQICDQSYMGASNLVDVYIRYLRRKIDDNFEKKMIRTVRGAGYCLEGERDEDTSDPT